MSKQVDVRVANLDCEHDAGGIKRGLKEFPGQAIATDGVVVIGTSSVNHAPVTGESVPVEKQPADPVFAGSINGEGSLEVRATRTFAENTISRIIIMVEEAQERKGKSQRFIERFGARYSPAVLLVGILIAIVPSLVGLGAWMMWISRAVVFVVAAAPGALVISIPVTLVAALGTGARHGVLIKGGAYVEELARVRVVALDKTGTITRGEPEVTDFPSCQNAARTPGYRSPGSCGCDREPQSTSARAGDPSLRRFARGSAG